MKKGSQRIKDGEEFRIMLKILNAGMKTGQITRVKIRHDQLCYLYSSDRRKAQEE